MGAPNPYSRFMLVNEQDSEEKHSYLNGPEYGGHVEMVADVLGLSAETWLLHHVLMRVAVDAFEASRWSHEAGIEPDVRLYLASSAYDYALVWAINRLAHVAVDLAAVRACLPLEQLISDAFEAGADSRPAPKSRFSRVLAESA